MKNFYTIDADLMREIGLNPTKWMICENIHFTQAITDSGYCESTRAKLAEHHDLSLAGLKRIIGELVECGMIKRNTKHHLKTTKKWHKASSSKNTMVDNNEGSKNATPKGSKVVDRGSKNATLLPIRENLERDRESCPSKKVESESMIEARNIAEYLLLNIEASIEKFKTPTETAFNNWVIETERLIRIDGNTPDEIIKLIDWIYKGKGAWWIKNIMSAPTLRDQFVKLWAQMTQDGRETVSAKKRILSEVGLGKVFFTYADKDLDAKVSLCLYGEYEALYDFYRNKYITKEKAVKLWEYIDKHADSILIKYRSSLS